MWKDHVHTVVSCQIWLERILFENDFEITPGSWNLTQELNVPRKPCVKLALQLSLSL